MRILATVFMVLALCGFAVVSHAAEENVVHIKSPAPGQHVVVPCRDAKRIIFDFEVDDASIGSSETNLVFRYHNGASVTLEGILPSDGNLEKVGDVLLQYGQSGAPFTLRDLVMSESRELEIGSAFSAYLTIGMPDKNARDTTLGPYPSIVALYEAAQAGKAEAQYLWAERFVKGNDIYPDADNEIFKLDTDNGNSKFSRAYAIALLAKAAKQGHFHARCHLALLHANEPDSEWSKDAEALFAELKAKKHDSPPDMYYFARFLADGVGTSKNPEMARQGFVRAALLDQPAACYALSVLYSALDATGAERYIGELLLVRASELGLPAASGILAERLERIGLPLESSAVDQDSYDIYEGAVAQAWRKLWAAQDTGLAFATAGEKYLKSKNLAKAIEYLTMGSNFGSAQAQFHLGECHEKGLGVAKDMNKAVELYKKASENDYEDATKRLKTLGE